MKKVLLLLISIMVLFSVALPVQAFEVGVRGYYWFPTISGDVKYSDGSLSGTKLDLEDDLNIDDESYPVGEIFISGEDHHLTFSFYRAEYDGTATLNQDINFGGETFPAGDEIKSTLDYDVYDLTYQYDLLDLENVLAGFSLGLVGRLRVYDLEFEIKSRTVDQSEK